MKKPVRRDATPARLPQPLDRSALERVTAGHKTVEPIAGVFQNFQSASGDGPIGE